MGNYLYYDPWTKTTLTPSQFETLRTQGRRQMPAGHPTGYDFSVEVEGWDGCTYVPPEDADDDAVLDDERRVEFTSSELERHAKPTWFVGPTEYPPIGS